MNDFFHVYLTIQLYDGGVYACSLSVNMENCARWWCLSMLTWCLSYDTWVIHTTRMNESCHKCEWVRSHIWMSHILCRHTTRMNESCHTCEWVNWCLSYDTCVGDTSTAVLNPANGCSLRVYAFIHLHTHAAMWWWCPCTTTWATETQRCRNVARLPRESAEKSNSKSCRAPPKWSCLRWTTPISGSASTQEISNCCFPRAAARLCLLPPWLSKQSTGRFRVKRCHSPYAWACIKALFMPTASRFSRAGFWEEVSAFAT